MAAIQILLRLEACCVTGPHVILVSAPLSFSNGSTFHSPRQVNLQKSDHVIDAVRCAMLVSKEGTLDPIGEETVSLKPVFTDPVFI